MEKSLLWRHKASGCCFQAGTLDACREREMIHTVILVFRCQRWEKKEIKKANGMLVLSSVFAFGVGAERSNTFCSFISLCPSLARCRGEAVANGYTDSFGLCSTTRSQCFTRDTRKYDYAALTTCNNVLIWLANSKYECVCLFLYEITS